MRTPELLLAARERSELTLRELGERAGTSAAALCTYESGKVRPRADVLERVLAVSGQQLACEPVARTRADRLSRALARHIADRLESRPQLLDAVLRSGPALSGDYADAWSKVLHAGVAPTVAVLRSSGELTQPMLSDNPLLSLVDHEDRLRIVEQTYAA